MKKTRTIHRPRGGRLTFALAGCLQVVRAAARAGGTATIKVSRTGETTRRPRTIAAMIAAFQKANPTVKVQDNWIQSDYQQKLTTSIAGGQAPDVAQTSNTMLADLQSAFSRSRSRRRITTRQTSPTG